MRAGESSVGEVGKAGVVGTRLLCRSSMVVGTGDDVLLRAAFNAVVRCRLLRLRTMTIKQKSVNEFVFEKQLPKPISKSPLQLVPTTYQLLIGGCCAAATTPEPVVPLEASLLCKISFDVVVAPFG